MCECVLCVCMLCVFGLCACVCARVSVCVCVCVLMKMTLSISLYILIECLCVYVCVCVCAVTNKGEKLKVEKRGYLLKIRNFNALILSKLPLQHNDVITVTFSVTKVEKSCCVIM